MKIRARKSSIVERLIARRRWRGGSIPAFMIFTDERVARVALRIPAGSVLSIKRSDGEPWRVLGVVRTPAHFNRGPAA